MSQALSGSCRDVSQTPHPDSVRLHAPRPGLMIFYRLAYNALCRITGRNKKTDLSILIDVDILIIIKNIMRLRGSTSDAEQHFYVRNAPSVSPV